MSSTALFKFRLYLAGNTPNSAEAKVNLAAMCRRHLPGRYNIEIIDVVKHPNRALTDGVYMTPTLIKMAPAPVRMIVGTLSQSDNLLKALGVSATTDEE